MKSKIYNIDNNSNDNNNNTVCNDICFGIIIIVTSKETAAASTLHSNSVSEISRDGIVVKLPGLAPKLLVSEH